MRTLTVFHIGGVGGPQRSLPQVMRWLSARGSVEFIVPDSGPTEEEYAELGPVSALDYSALTYARGPREGLRLARRLVRELRMFRGELRRRRPDLVVAVTTVLPALLLAARLERIPVVVFAAELYEQRWKSAPLLRVWGALLARGTARLSKGVVCCSAAVAAQFPRRGGKPIVVAYPPVGTEYEGGDRDSGRRRFGLDPSHRCMAVVGSISRGRGQDVGLRALALIRERVPSARLLIVGDPHPRTVDREYARELRKLAAALGVADAVVWAGADVSGHGPRAMADVYAAADLVVNPARFAEPFGRVAAEALVARRPVVATRIGGIPEVIRDGVDGLLVPPDDPVALAAAVTRILDEPSLGDTLVANGRKRVLEKFGYEQDLIAWRRVIEAALSPESARFSPRWVSPS
jgi:glycosyltransferase involved in cell wall biosynthesis